MAESNGLLQWMNTPGGMGLLSAVGAGLAGARRGGAWNAFGSGLLGGVQGVAQGQELQRQNEYAAQRGKLFDMQAQQMEQQQAAARAEAEARAKRQGYLGTIGQVTSPRTDAQPNQFDPTQWLRLGGSIDEAQKLSGMKDWGAAEVARTIEGQDAQGNKVTYQYDKFGRPVGGGVQAYIAPERVDLGGSVQFVRPQAGVSLNKTQSPDSVASNAVAWYNAKTSRDRLLFDQGGGADGVGSSQASLVKKFGKPSAGYRWKDDGSQEFIPGGPADQKAQLQKAGEGTVGSVIADLRDKYNVLDRENAIVSENNKWGTNIAAKIGSTGFGQTLSGAVGSKAQSARDSIAMTRPLLLQAIMKATGMSAKQMDSNAELKMYLATATDPTLGLQANQEALDRLEKLYGGGGDPIAPSGGKPTTPKPQGKTVVRTGTMNGRKVVQYSDGTAAYVD